MNYTPQTEVHLLSNVPFNFSYNNVLDFITLNEQTAYFLNKSKLTFDDLTHQRVNNNTINLEVAYEDLYDINYMMFQNEKIPGKWFYAFITKYDFISPKVTRITYQIDVYQTWLFDMQWQTTYVEREHTKRFNQDGTPVINTIEEGLSYGSDYKTIYKRKCNDDNIIWLVAITKKSIQALLGQSPVYTGRIANISQPLHYVVLPLDLDGDAVTINGKYPGDTYIRELGNDPDTVGQLVSLFYTPYVPFTYNVDNNNNITTSDSNVHFIDGGSVGGFYDYYGDNNWIPRNYNITNNMFSLMPNYSESKLLMYPYTIIELTDMQGNTSTLKPQNFDDKSLSFDIMGCISAQPKTAIYPHGYLGNTSGNVVDFTNGIINNNICDVPIVDDYTASYMQANRNSIATTNKYAMDNAWRGVIQNNANNRMNNAIIDREQFYNQADMGVGMMSSALNLQFGGMLSSAYQGIKNYDLTEGKRTQMNMNNKFANQNLMVNAEQSIGLTQAKIQDINNIPPTVSNLGNNTMFDTGWKNMHFYVMIKTVRDEYATQLTNYFKMFGYKVNKLEIPNLRSRENYNYIKTIDANIVGNIPANDLSAIKGIFDKGVTIWHTDDIGNYDLSNDEVEESPYTFVDYIQSDEQSIINTNVMPSNKIDMEVDMSDISTTEQFGSLFGWRNGSTNQFWNYILTASGRCLSRYGTTEYSTTYMYSNGERIKVRQNSTGYYINNQLQTEYSSATIEGNSNIYIFATNNNGNSTQWKISAKLYGAKIYDDNVLIRDFKPCYRNSDGEVGLLDIVNDVFYTNDGTGEFTYG